MADAPVLTPAPTGNPLLQAWLVLVLAVVCGGGLAAVQLWLSPIIAENKRAETFGQVPALIGAEPATVTAVTVAGRSLLRANDASGAVIGWVIPASGQGFADRIELLIAVDPACSVITGLYVIDQKETPGLGDWITGAAWRGQWPGKRADAPLRVVKAGGGGSGEILAVTGATISSESVADIVNAALAGLRGPLAAAAGGAHVE